MTIMIGDGLVRALEINRCCCCLDHRLGVVALGIGSVCVSLAALIATIILIFHLKDACYGIMPVALGEQCVANLDSDQEGLSSELVALSYYLEDFKLSFHVWLVSSVIVFATAVLASAMLAAGALLGRESLMIPWLTLMKLSVFMLIMATLLIFYLEAEVFRPGTSVFGLFALFTAFGAGIFAYFWLVAQSLYTRMVLEDELLFDKTPLLPHLNPAFDAMETSLGEMTDDEMEARSPMEVWVREGQSMGEGAMPLRVLAAAEKEQGICVEVIESSPL